MCSIQLQMLVQIGPANVTSFYSYLGCMSFLCADLLFLVDPCVSPVVLNLSRRHLIVLTLVPSCLAILIVPIPACSIPMARPYMHNLWNPGHIVCHDKHEISNMLNVFSKH